MGCHLCADREDKNVIKKKQEETVEEKKSKLTAKKQWEENRLCVWWKEKEWKETVKKCLYKAIRCCFHKCELLLKYIVIGLERSLRKLFFLYLIVSLCFLSSLQEKKKSVVKAIQQERANMSEVTTKKKKKSRQISVTGESTLTHTQKKRTMKELHYIAIICASFSIVLKNMKSWNR